MMLDKKLFHFISTMDEHLITSLQLWAASKVIGRECSTINKEFWICKKNKGENPIACEEQGKLATSCAAHV